MTNPLVQELRDQIRGVTGALLVVGLTFHYTMETWWLGWTLPLPYLAGYAFVGLSLVVAVTRAIGFHEDERRRGSSPWQQVVRDYAEILMQSFVASYTMLLVLGIIDVTTSPNLIVRLAFIELAPLGFGAALANRLFGESGDEARAEEGRFPQNLAVFALGAVFVASTVAPTQEMELIAVHMDWRRFPLLIALTLVLVYLILYELEFKGQRSRLAKSRPLQVGTVFIVYVVGASVAFFLLLGFGHFIDGTVALMYQETIVLAFPASLGAAAAEVIV